MWLGDEDPRLEDPPGILPPRERVPALRAAVPGARLHAAHPAIGLDPTADDVPRELSRRRLRRQRGWRSLTCDEQDELEVAYFLRLMERIRAQDAATWELWVLDRSPALFAALAPHVEPRRRTWGRAVLRGELTATTAAILAAHDLDVLMVEQDGVLRLVVWGGWRAAGLWLAPHEADDLRAQLASADLSDPALRAVRPAGRLHQVHPAIGVRRVGEDGLERLDDRELGMAWLALPEAEQRMRERLVLSELLAWGREHGVATRLEPAATEELLRASIWHAPDEELDGLHVDHPDAVRFGLQLIESQGPRETGVWIAPDEAGPLQQRLTDAWWEPWQRRLEAVGRELEPTRDGGRVSRETRARVVLWFPRVAGLAFVACGLALDRTLELSWADVPLAVAVGGVLFTVLWMIENRLERWYERS